jgi:hypothetical protein
LDTVVDPFGGPATLVATIVKESTMAYENRFIQVDGLKTRYLETGTGPSRLWPGPASESSPMTSPDSVSPMIPPTIRFRIAAASL